MADKDLMAKPGKQMPNEFSVSSNSFSEGVAPKRVVVGVLTGAVLSVFLSGCSGKQDSQPMSQVAASAPAPALKLSKFEELKKSADAGDAAAMFKLSQMYADGKEVERNNTLADSYLAKAAEASNPDAVYKLADSFGIKIALSFMLEGNTNEEKFANGIKAFKETERLYSIALELGVKKAYRDLGHLYLSGLSDVAFELHIPPSKVPKDYVGDVAKALPYFEKGANLGNPHLMVVMYRIHSIPKWKHLDSEKADSWHKKIVALTDAGDLGVAADTLYYGILAQDRGFYSLDEFKPEPAWVREAQPLLERAADGGDTKSKVLLARIYLNGFDKQKDPSVAAEYLEKAAAADDIWSQVTLGRLYMAGSGVFQDYSAAWKLFNKAATSPDFDIHVWEAQYLLGALLERGLGVPKDLVLAHAWYNISATHGYDKAGPRRNALTSQLSAEELAEAHTLAKNWKAGAELSRGSTPSAPSTAPSSGTASKKVGTGTLFYVNAEGMAITNSHVVAGCKEVKVEGSDSAKVVTQDTANDLALVKIAGANSAFGRIDSDPGKIRQGEEIVVFGYPLNSVLSSGGNLTPGVISALTGLGNNTNQLQITAPIQPGSSGSPVLNAKGNVIGVVAMKLSDSKMAQTTGQVAQNINFAISGQSLKAFLDAHQVSYTSGGGFFSLGKSKADLADDARKWTAVIECWK